MLLLGFAYVSIYAHSGSSSSFVKFSYNNILLFVK